MPKPTPGNRPRPAEVLQYKHKKTPLGYPINYPVPNFGVDADVLTTARSIEIGEDAHAHKLIMATPESRAHGEPASRGRGPCGVS